MSSLPSCQIRLDDSIVERGHSVSPIVEADDYVVTEASLKDLLPGALVALGVRGEESSIDLWPARHIVIVLIDGLGELQLSEFSEYAPRLSAGESISCRTEFPSTTPVALGSFGTGLTPGEHGLIAANFWLPETQAMFAPLKWGSEPHPLLIAPEETYFEKAEKCGISTLTIGQEKHRSSGLSRSVLRGSHYLGASSIAEIIELFAKRQEDLSRSVKRALTYIYWPDVDRIGHVYGVGSSQWCEALSDADHLVDRLNDLLRTEETMVVTADHGMVNCEPEHRIAIESNPMLAYGIERVGGEPRVRHLYVNSGSMDQTLNNWRHELQSRAEIFTRQEVLDRRLYLIGDDDLAERVGDIVVLPTHDYMLTSVTDPRTSHLRGQHGGLTPAEMLIPLRQYAGS